MERHRPIVVAESDFLTGRLLIASLEAGNRAAVVGHDGETVLRLIDTNRPELLVLSMNLVRPGGVEMLRMLRQKNANLKILATTLGAQADLRAAGRAFGVSAFLELPFSPDELNEVVGRALGAAS